MADLKRANDIMDWLWKQMHQAGHKMPADRLIFEGDHDLVYLYNTGFVDTDKFTLDKWIVAFRESRKPDGSYDLSYDQWLEKVAFRFNEKVEAPFDPATIREGEWTVDEWRNFIKENFLPETTVSFEVFCKAIEDSILKGTIQNDTVIITAEKKQNYRQMLDKTASPRRHRALSVMRIRQREELEAPAGQPQTKKTSSRPPVAEQEKTKFDSAPDKQKHMSGQLSDLLSGSKK